MKTQKTETNIRRFMSIVTISLGMALVAGALILFAPEAGFSQGAEPVGPTKPVKIVNTEAEPVPIKGSVAVTGSVNLAPGTKVGIEGTANVRLVDNTVIVGNSEAAPVQVRDINRKLTMPVHGGTGLQIIIDQPQAQTAVMYTVPPGKRLVIEFISADVLMDGSSANPDILVTTTLGGNTQSHTLALTPQNDDYKNFGFSGMTKIYAEAGTNVTATFLIFAPATAINNVLIRFSGYLEDL